MLNFTNYILIYMNTGDKTQNWANVLQGDTL